MVRKKLVHHALVLTLLNLLPVAKPVIPSRLLCYTLVSFYCQLTILDLVTMQKVWTKASYVAAEMVAIVLVDHLNCGPFLCDRIGCQNRVTFYVTGEGVKMS